MQLTRDPSPGINVVALSCRHQIKAPLRLAAKWMKTNTLTPNQKTVMTLGQPKSLVPRSLCAMLAYLHTCGNRVCAVPSLKAAVNQCMSPDYWLLQFGSGCGFYHS